MAEPEAILEKTREMLTTARRGLGDLEGSDPARRMIGLRNLVVFGRSVTYVLQTLRRVSRLKFDTWYGPYEREMRDDPLLRYFHNLRNTILKEGGPATSQSMYLRYLNTDDLQPLLANPPPGAKDFFIGDNVGGSGWTVELPDGTAEKYYVDLPSAVRLETTFHFPDAPGEHLGQEIADTSVPNLGRLYLHYLSRLVKSAEAEFS
jgi:hypothetical protein